MFGHTTYQFIVPKPDHQRYIPGNPYDRYATWELANMVKARSFLSALNSPDEARELRTMKQELARRRKLDRDNKALSRTRTY